MVRKGIGKQQSIDDSQNPLIHGDFLNPLVHGDCEKNEAHFSQVHASRDEDEAHFFRVQDSSG
jgi:hypothetical protein